MRQRSQYFSMHRQTSFNHSGTETGPFQENFDITMAHEENNSPGIDNIS